MGGIGSTRWGTGPTKGQTGSYSRVDIRQLKRDGHLDSHGQKRLTWTDQCNQQSSIDILVNDDGIGFSYRSRTGDGPWKQVKAWAWLTYTSEHLGGRRVWFSCPDCGKRCAILYVGARVACRGCFDLLYTCQVETKADRAIRRANKAAQRLGITNAMQGVPAKPKYMHHRTYSQLVRQFEHAQLVALAQLRL